MFPDPTLQWRPYPSVMDGMRPPPFVLDRGLWRGVLNLIVLECSPGSRAYGVQIRSEAYSAFEEMIYSVAPHGDAGSRYDGSVYIKEAISSRLLEVYAEIDPFKRNVRHFLFVGTDFCYEAISAGEPIIRTFKGREEAYAWVPDREDGSR